MTPSAAGAGSKPVPACRSSGESAEHRQRERGHDVCFGPQGGIADLEKHGERDAETETDRGAEQIPPWPVWADRFLGHAGRIENLELLADLAALRRPACLMVVLSAEVVSIDIGPPLRWRVEHEDRWHAVGVGQSKAFVPDARKTGEQPGRFHARRRSAAPAAVLDRGQHRRFEAMQMGRPSRILEDSTRLPQKLEVAEIAAPE